MLDIVLSDDVVCETDAVQWGCSMSSLTTDPVTRKCCWQLLPVSLHRDCPAYLRLHGVHKCSRVQLLVFVPQLADLQERVGAISF